MAVPVVSVPAQSTDPGAGSGKISAPGPQASVQGETAERTGGGSSFLQLLRGEEEAQGEGEPQPAEQAQGSVSLRLLAFLFQLDPSQLAELTSGQAQAGARGVIASTGEGARLSSLLQNVSAEGKGLKALLQHLSGESRSPAELSELLGRMQNGRSGESQSLMRLVALMQASGGETPETPAGAKFSDLVSRAEGARQGRTDVPQHMEQLLQHVISGEGTPSGSFRGSSMDQLLTALQEASDQGRISGEQLQWMARDLLSLTAENTSQQKAGMEASQLGRLAAALQQAEGEGEASGRQLARLFLESFGRGEHSAGEKGRSPLSAKGKQNPLLQDKSLVQSLVRQGQTGIQAVESSSARSSGQSEGAHPGVSLKSGQWGSLLSSVRGGAEGSATGAAIRSSQSTGTSSIMDNQVLQQVMSKFQTELQRGSSRINIRMHPPELGHVRLQLLSEDSNMQVQLQVQNTQVQSILERNMPALRQALEQQNLDFESIQVSVESGQGDGSPHHSGERESDFSSRPKWSGYSEAQAGDPDVETLPEHPAEPGGISLRV